ncbi:d70c841f-5c4a-42ff-affe-d08574b73a03 [Thermothielavioides terrestris]|uniref:D70c841f-5c4a-42ff-affe-d08574b73a03 n=1 Tax=Thermothielavioides terrestris TaxID=2587410 RepID=A0A3S4D4J6_9PEZI|nr:d70c841f-5c4a-42ff-affe-d08574b73a03 [Thermothielavioides terrestris]
MDTTVSKPELVSDAADSREEDAFQPLDRYHQQRAKTKTLDAPFHPSTVTYHAPVADAPPPYVVLRTDDKPS